MKLNTDAVFSGGSDRSSDEALVMRVEQRDDVTSVLIIKQLVKG